MAGASISPTGNQTWSQAETDAFLKSSREQASTKNPRVLWILQIPLMRAKSNGYPIDLHHPTLEMRQAFKEEEEQALAQAGYQRQYIYKEWPKTLFRRNMDAKFEPEFDPNTGTLLREPFIEERLARTEKDEIAFRLMKPKSGQSDWFDTISKIPAIEEGPTQEDLKMQVARLEGELSARREGGKQKVA